MKRNDPTFKEMVSRITSGELTRAQASEAYSVNPSTLNVWLSRSGITAKDTVKKPRALHGAALGWAIDDPERDAALKEALDEVITKGTPVRKVAAAYAERGVTTSTLALMARKHLAEQGIRRATGRPRVNPLPEGHWRTQAP